jgi:hypothetical protein
LDSVANRHEMILPKWEFSADLAVVSTQAAKTTAAV